MAAVAGPHSVALVAVASAAGPQSVSLGAVAVAAHQSAHQSVMAAVADTHQVVAAPYAYQVPLAAWHCHWAAVAVAGFQAAGATHHAVACHLAGSVAAVHVGPGCNW